MSDPAYEPFVILDRGTPSPARRRWTVFHGRKPAILLVDRGGTEGTGLDLPLAGEGFEVYRTPGRESAVELLRAHPSILMALVRADLPGHDPAALIRTLRETRPGLWVGLICDPADKERASAGYAAGAVDLFDPSKDASETVARLIRGAPWALRLREESDRRRERRPEPRWRRGLRKTAARLGIAALLVFGLSLGVVLAAATRAWHESQDRWSERLERWLSALESPRSAPDRFERQFRIEQRNLHQETQQAIRVSQQEQLEQMRLQDLLRNLPPPQYSTR